MKSGQDLPPDTLLALGVQVVVCWDGQTRPNNISRVSIALFDFGHLGLLCVS